MRIVSLLSTTLTASALALSACAASSDASTETAAALADISPPSPDAGANGRWLLRDASGTVLAELGLNGTGCRVGEAEITASDDALTYTITLPALKATTGPSAVATSSCTVSVLATDRTREFGVTRVHYEGAAALGAAGDGSLQFRLWNTGGASSSGPAPRFMLKAPLEGSVVREHVVPEADVLYTRCDVRRPLLLDVRVQARSPTPGAQASVGGTPSTVIVQLGTRPCAPGSDAGPPPLTK